MYPSIYDDEDFADARFKHIEAVYRLVNGVAKCQGQPKAVELWLVDEARFQLALAKGYLAIGAGAA